MPSTNTHCAISKKRTHFDFRKLHEWIDAPSKDMGREHRRKRHALNTEDLNRIREHWDREKGRGWGDKAIIEWLFHIALDNLDTAFKMSRKTYGDNTYNLLLFGFARSKFIHVDFDKLSDRDLEAAFKGAPGDYEEEDEFTGLFDVLKGFFSWFK